MIVQQLYKVLVDKWPALLTISAIVYMGFFVATLPARLIRRVPLVGQELGGYEKRRIAYQNNAQRLYSEGYRLFKESIFRLTTQHESPTIVVPVRYLRELRDLPDSVLSVTESVKETMHTKYTEMQDSIEALPDIIKKNLTPALARLNPIISGEIAEAVRVELSPCEEWTSVNINQKLLRIVAVVSGRVLVGPELCRTEQYLEAAINYTTEVMAAQEAVARVTPWKRPFVCKKLPEVQALRDRKAKETAFLKPVIEARLRMSATERPDDMLQWLLSSRPKDGARTMEAIADLQLSSSFASIHTTTMTLTNILYSLAAMPGMVEELRDEITTVLENHDGIFSSRALHAMQKVDSFMKEALRCYAPSMASFQRKVLQPITLSNGQVIPAGVMIEVAAKSIMCDPDVFHNPETFDGLRFYKSRQQPAADHGDRLESSSHRNQFVSVSSDSLAFGYGRHACPGRFFAANEIKMILAHIIVAYDIRMEESETKRYSNIQFANFCFPDPAKTLLFKKIVV